MSLKENLIKRIRYCALIAAAFVMSAFSVRADKVPSGGIYISDEITVSTVINHKRITVAEGAYSDTYFDNDDVPGNVPLLRASALASASTYGNASVDYLQDALFDDAERHFTGTGKSSTRSDNDHCVIFTGTKRTPDGKRIIAVIVSGYSKGGLEWISNFNLGRGPVHAGFEQASEEVIGYLDELYSPGEDDILWITGHSRGGAVTNLVAEHYIEAGKCRVFAYGFAVPNPVDADLCSDTPRIVNVVNSGDYVPTIPLDASFETWNYGKHGRTVTFDVDDQIKEKFKEHTGQKAYIGYSVEERDHLVRLFDEACNYTKEGFFTPRPEKNKSAVSPQTYFQRGLAMGMSTHLLYQAEGLDKMAEYAESDSVYYQMTEVLLEDGMLHQKIFDAHCCEVYLSYAESLSK